MQIDFCHLKAAVEELEAQDEDIGPGGSAVYQIACQKRCVAEVQHELHSFTFYSQTNVCGM